MSIIGKWYGFGKNPAYDRGVREFARGGYELAAAEFRSSLTELSDPEMRESARNRLVDCLALSADGQVRAGKSSAAADLLAEAIKIRPRYADLRLRLAEALLLEGRTDESRQQANVALEINKGFTRALLIKAATFAESDPDTTRQLINQAAEAGLPADELRRIHDHLDSGRGRAAAASLIELRPTAAFDAKSLAEIGSEMARQGRWHDAEQSYAKAIEAEPKWADLRCRHGEVLIESGRFAEAFDAFSSAIEINPKYADALAMRGVVRRKLSDEEGARADFRAAIAINPNHTVAVQELSRLVF